MRWLRHRYLIKLAALLLLAGCAKIRSLEHGKSHSAPAPAPATPPQPQPSPANGTPFDANTVKQAAAPATPGSADSGGGAGVIGFGAYAWVGTSAWTLPTPASGQVVDFKGYRFVSTVSGLFAADLSESPPRFLRVSLVDLGAETDLVDKMSATTSELWIETPLCVWCTSRRIFRYTDPKAPPSVSQVPTDAALVQAGAESYWFRNGAGDATSTQLTISTDAGQTFTDALGDGEWSQVSATGGWIYALGLAAADDAAGMSVGLYGFPADAPEAPKRLAFPPPTQLTSTQAALVGVLRWETNGAGNPDIAALGVSTDHGATFSPAARLDVTGLRLQVLAGNPNTSDVFAVMAPSSGSTVTGQVLVSRDGGATFGETLTWGTGGVPAIVQDLALSDSSVFLYGPATSDASDIPALAVSTDGGKTFAALPGSGPAFPPYPRGARFIDGAWYWPRSAGIFKADATFTTFTKALGGTGYRVDATAKEILAQTDSGLFASADGTKFGLVNDQSVWKSSATAAAWLAVGEDILFQSGQGELYSVDYGSTFSAFPGVATPAESAAGVAQNEAAVISGVSFLCLEGHGFAFDTGWTNRREITMPFPCAGMRAASQAQTGVADTLVVWDQPQNGSSPHLMSSTDAGAHFATMTLSCTTSEVDDVALVGANGVYAGTDAGLALSSDGGQSFKLDTEKDGLPGGQVVWVQVIGTDLYLGTAGGVARRVLP